MWYDDDPFLQLPYMDYDKLKNLRKKQKSLTLESYCLMNAEQRKAIGVYDNEKEFLESEMAISSFPLIEVKVEYFVEGEKEIAVGDIMTIKINLTHMNLEEKQQ